MKPTHQIRKWIYGVTFFFLVLTGFGQMPVYKRYYISDIPGLGWISDFYVTHALHYIFAFIFIALTAYVILTFIINRTGKITGTGYIKIFILAGLVISGIIMVARNLSGVFLNHGLVIAMDLTHLGLTMLLMAVSLYTLITKKKWVQ